MARSDILASEGGAVATISENLAAWTNYDWPAGGDEWSAIWGGGDACWYGTILPRIHRWVPARTILEIAPGFGRCTAYLQQLAERLILVDLTPKCIEACKRRFAAARHIDYFVNDGHSLPVVADRSVDFIFTYDSLVHADADAIRGYIREFARVLASDGVAFLHHSNVGSLPRAVISLGKEIGHRRHFASLSPVRHWRSEDVSARAVDQWTTDVGLMCRSQELVRWGTVYLSDCFSVITRPGSRWARANRVTKNLRFMQEIADI